jgi:hypothetical protein
MFIIINFVKRFTQNAIVLPVTDFLRHDSITVYIVLNNAGPYFHVEHAMKIVLRSISLGGVKRSQKKSTSLEADALNVVTLLTSEHC